MTLRKNPLHLNDSSKEIIFPSSNIRRDPASIRTYAPILLEGFYMVERATGYMWTPTSYGRNARSHKLWKALDIVPLFAPDLKAQFGPFKRIPSDPVLPLRLTLVNKLLTLTTIPPSSIPWDVDKYSLMVFIEPDHLHLEVGAPQTPPISVIKWHGVKPVYEDSAKRGSIRPFFGSYPCSH